VDYTATSGSLQFQPGFATGTISIPIIDRVGAQGIRLFQVDLSNATGGAVLGSPSTLAITILDSGYPATIQFAIAQITVRETDRRVSLRVTRQGDISGTSTIGYATVAGTATAGVDFTPVSGTLTFGPGETDKIIVVAIRNDIEGTSVTFGLILTSPTGAVIGPQRTVVVTILPQRVTAPLVFKGQRGLPHIAAQSKPGVPVQRPR
jgi:hypothetical protein